MEKLRDSPRLTMCESHCKLENPPLPGSLKVYLYALSSCVGLGDRLFKMPSISPLLPQPSTQRVMFNRL